MSDLIPRIKPSSARSFAVTLLLILVSVWGLTFSETNRGAYPELSRLFRVDATTSPTVTYSGYVAMKFYGTYHYLIVVPACRSSFIPCLVADRTVFYLDASGETIQLIFYCALDYCKESNQIALSNGAPLYATGTLMTPSTWPSGSFEPNLTFNGDLYVFNYTPA
jgi:hypothetical protein